ncbi:MAG: hypothetical protein SFW67_04750 [Myxococcaceae bacterium]|nr:hypothetical protein [Myxococcaceae bacterium]
MLQMGFAAHVIASFAQVTITRDVYGSGDIMVYWAEGVALADALRYDFSGIAPGLIDVFLHREGRLPFELYGGGATASQSVFSAFLQFVTGNSLYASSILLAMLALLGKAGIYSALKNDFEPEVRPRLGAAIVLLPSAVYWCGSLAKEAVAIAFFGILTWALRTIFERRSIAIALGAAVLSATIVAMIKAYILLAFSLSAGVWLYWSVQQKRTGTVVVKPVFLLLGAALAVGGITLVGRLNPEYGAEQVRERATKQAMYGASAGGDSYYELASGTDEERPLSQQLALAPAGLFTALFRPLLFEARSAMVFINAIESTGLFVVALIILRRLGFRGVWERISSSPSLMFCLVFSVSFGSAVGVLTTNLGTLSRYRAPMMPLFAGLLAVLWMESLAARRRAAAVAEQRPRALAY